MFLMVFSSISLNKEVAVKLVLKVFLVGLISEMCYFFGYRYRKGPKQVSSIKKRQM